MNLRFLIDSITQQTTVLIAQLATLGGGRAPLARVANQVFLELSRELDTLGVTRKVAADMFGLALRSYRGKLRRLEESASGPERKSLWQAVYEFVDEDEAVKLQEILTRFRHDDEASVRGILYDLVQTGLLSETGQGHNRIYRRTRAEDFEALHSGEDQDSVFWTAWMYIYRDGPVSRARLEERLGIDGDKLDDVLERLLAEGQVGMEGEDPALDADDTLFYSDDCYIPADAPAGWEAAVFDHFSAVTKVLTTRLRELKYQTMPPEWVGGSTYTFDVWEGHPLFEEVTGLLQRHRAETSELNGRVREHNATSDLSDQDISEVTFYFGQTVIRQDEAFAGESSEGGE